MKKVYSLFTLLALLFLFTGAWAQQKTDVVYLKNGSVIKGELVENNESTTKIKTICGNVWVFEKDEIQKTETLDEPLPGYMKNSGYFNFTTLGFLIGSNADDNPAIVSIIMDHSYKINNHLLIGGITGLEFFNETSVPLGINVKGMLTAKGKSAFFTQGSMGYSVPVEEVSPDDYNNYKDTRGGLFAAAGMGVIFPSQSNLNFFIGLGYRYNELNYVREDWFYGDIDRKVKYNRFSLKFGIVFQ